jgi:endonuclease/exonuclease/phosphatase (EEP) superfamily protein YafD
MRNFCETRHPAIRPARLNTSGLRAAQDNIDRDRVGLIDNPKAAMAMSGSVVERAAHGEFSALRDQGLRRRIFALAALLTLSLLAASLLACTAGWLWLGELAVHFALQYAGLALIAFVAFLTAGRPVWAALALAVATSNAMIAAPVMATRPPEPPAAAVRGSEEPARVRIAALNVFYANRQFQRVVDFIHREHPDAVVLVEMNDTWRRALAGVEREFPYGYHTRGSSGTGVSMWSRLPMKDVGVLPVEVHKEPAIQATLMTSQGRPLRLFGVHTTWPMAPGSAARRNRQLALLAQRAHEAGAVLPLAVVGDLNVSPFSPYFRELLARGGLRSAADGFGWEPTWPSFLPPAGIQIDHALVTPAITVQSFRRGPFDGSDHRPIVVDLLL